MEALSYLSNVLFDVNYEDNAQPKTAVLCHIPGPTRNFFQEISPTILILNETTQLDLIVKTVNCFRVTSICLVFAWFDRLPTDLDSADDESFSLPPSLFFSPCLQFSYVIVHV